MFKKFFRKVRETVKKIAPIAAPIAGMALGPLAGMGIGALMGQYGGKKGALQGAMLGGLGGLGKNYFDKTGIFGPSGIATKLIGGVNAAPGKSGTGIKNMLNSLLGGGGGKSGIANLLTNDKLISLITGLLAKKGFDQQDMSKADINDYRSLIDEKNQSVTGGSPFAADRMGGLQYDPTTETYFDFKDKEGQFQDWQVDDDGRIINDFVSSTGYNQGGVASLNMGGNPHRMSFPLRRATGGEIFDQSMSGEIFDPRMSGNEMMKEIKDNPGITQYFPPQFGEITGPGGPKDDKIPAMLSDGEFVMTAKAVDNAGGPKAMYNLMNQLDPESSKGKGIIS